MLLKNDEHAQSTLSMMRRNGLRLLQLINQLLGPLPDGCREDVRSGASHGSGETLSRSLVMSFLSLAERKKIQLIVRS